MSTARVDWSDVGSVIDQMVSYTRMLAGAQRPFDEAATRNLVRRDLERARDFGAGHGVARADWQTIVRAILKHTGGLTTMGL